jgi:hypothetical protein
MVALTLEDGRIRAMLSIGAMLLAAMLFLGANARPAWSATKDLSRSDLRGPVMVTATYLPSEKATDDIRIQVRLNTHSVDLAQYRLQDLASIRFDAGKEVKSLGVTVRGAGHHVPEILRFAGPVPKGAREMTLILRNLGDVPERTLQRKLPVE